MVVLQQKKWAAVVRGHVVDTVAKSSPQLVVSTNTWKLNMKAPMLKSRVPSIPKALASPVLMVSRSRSHGGTKRF